jgi:CheY-like chemotaxis protein
LRAGVSAIAAAEPTEPAVLVAGASRSPVRIDGVRVLVIDDDMNARELLAVILENAGAELRAAASAEDALMILQSWTPEIMLSDIEMPGDDGYGLIEKARRLTEGHGRLVAVALTAHARPEDRVRALEAGFKWHLAKPIDPSELLSVLATVLAKEKGLGTFAPSPLCIANC